MLATLVEAYETGVFRCRVPTPSTFSTWDRGHGPLAGGACGASRLARPPRKEGLKRKRRLTVELIAKVSEASRVPVEALAKPYTFATDAA